MLAIPVATQRPRWTRQRINQHIVSMWSWRNAVLISKPLHLSTTTRWTSTRLKGVYVLQVNNYAEENVDCTNVTNPTKGQNRKKSCDNCYKYVGKYAQWMVEYLKEDVIKCDWGTFLTIITQIKQGLWLPFQYDVHCGIMTPCGVGSGNGFSPFWRRSFTWNNVDL